METIFFPRTDYPNNVSICDHYQGKLMTYTEQTDAVREPSFSHIMEMANARNIKVGANTYYEDANNIGKIKEYLTQKQLWIDAYSLPVVGGGIHVTEEEYDLFYQEKILPYFVNNYGFKPTALSYGYGNESYKQCAKKYFLAGRNSDISGNSDYGVGCGNPSDIPYNLTNYISRSSSARWYDAVHTSANPISKEESLSNIATLIDNAKQTSGWVNNFTHWHNVENDGNMAEYEEYFDLLASKNQDNSIAFLGYGEAVGYLVYRSIIKKVSMYVPKAQNDRIVIRLYADDADIVTNTELIRTPISVKFSLKGTILEGKKIQCNHNLIKLSEDEYIVDIPYSRFPYAEIVA